MKKTAIWMSLAMVWTCVLMVGCQTGASKMTPEEQIKVEMENWRTAMANKDLDGIMALFSDNFKHYDWRNKDGARQFIKDAIDIGYLDGIDVILEDAEIKVDGQSATVYPVDIVGGFGSLTMELMLANEGGKWLLVGMDAPGL